MGIGTHHNYAWVFVLAFVVLGIYAIVDGERTDNKQQEWLFQLNNRIQTLEEQRDLEQRVTDIEKSLRIYCTGSKIDMCGKLGPTR